MAESRYSLRRASATTKAALVAIAISALGFAGVIVAIAANSDELSPPTTASTTQPTEPVTSETASPTTSSTSAATTSTTPTTTTSSTTTTVERATSTTAPDVATSTSTGLDSSPPTGRSQVAVPDAVPTNALDAFNAVSGWLNREIEKGDAGTLSDVNRMYLGYTRDTESDGLRMIDLFYVTERVNDGQQVTTLYCAYWKYDPSTGEVAGLDVFVPQVGEVEGWRIDQALIDEADNDCQLRVRGQ